MEIEILAHRSEDPLEKALRVIGREQWMKLPSNIQERFLGDNFCPAGGWKEERYLDDGSRYWERSKNR